MGSACVCPELARKVAGSCPGHGRIAHGVYGDSLRGEMGESRVVYRYQQLFPLLGPTTHPVEGMARCHGAS